MALLKRGSDEEREQARREKVAEREAAERDRRLHEFLATPAGRARTAYERGDHVLQLELDVQQTKAVVVPMVGATAARRTSDPTAILNSVCNEGWSIVNGAFVFIELGSESRDKFLASGQNIAVKGTVVGYYLFERCEENRRPTAATQLIASIDV